MKRKPILLSAIIGLTIALSSFVIVSVTITDKNTQTMTNHNNYDKDWKKVDSLIQKDLPQSALEIVETIYSRARADNNSPQFIKAILYRMKLQAEFKEDFMVNIIGDAEKEISRASFPEKQILHSILAELYWRFYQSDRHEILDRTATLGFDQKDIRTWDVNKFVYVTILNYRQSLESAAKLQAISLKDYDPILITQESSKMYRPSLYDFLVHRAIDFYMNEESGLTEPVYKFVMDSPEYFKPCSDFIGMDISTKDTMSLKFHAINLFKDIIRFHLDDKSPEALIDVDLKRLQFVRQYAFMEIKDSLYIEALKSLLGKYSGFPASAEVSYKLAQALFDRGDNYQPLKSDLYKWDIKEAYQYCQKAINAFPDAEGSKRCKSLMSHITEKALNLTTTYGNVEGQSFLGLVSYKNSPEIFIRIISLPAETDRRLREGKRAKELVVGYLRLPVLKEWKVGLIDDGDFQTHATEIKIPELPLGYYVILASTDKDFSYTDEVVAYSSFWISNISYINRQAGDGSIEFYVLDREKGTPLAGVNIQTFYRNYDYNQRRYDLQPWNTYTTGEDGFFTIPALLPRTDSKSFIIRFAAGNDTLITDNYFYQYGRSPEPQKMRPKTFFFTDRAIYRPGQTVYFKGIVIETDGKINEILPGYKSSVRFYDINGQKISEVAVISNDYGSFNGSFTAPVGVLTGQMTISNESGSVEISVEEYKRPNFEVIFNPVKGVYKLNEPVSVQGRAKSYSGANIDNAQVKYRVVRQARFPYLSYWWRNWFRSTPDMEIVNGIAVTDAEGNFTIVFQAVPDATIEKKFKPVFNYHVIAEVTDINGETQTSETTVSVGYTALLINVDVPDGIDKSGKAEFKLLSTNLNGQKEPARGMLTISKLIEPDRLFRERLWEQPDKFIMTKEEFYDAFPHDVYNDEDNIEKWKTGQSILNKAFDTENDSLIALTDLQAWENGQYVLKASTTDKFGQQVEVTKYFIIYSPSDKKAPVNEIYWFLPQKMNGEPGENAAFLIGTKDKNINILYEIIKDDKIIHREWIKLNAQQKFIGIPLKEEYRGNFMINLACVRFNRSYMDLNTVTVPYTNKALDFEFSSFRDKLMPGQAEEWSIKIKDKRGEEVAAEMVASMYDASLDVFVPHAWDFSLFEQTDASSGWNVQNAFSVKNTQDITETSKLYEYPGDRTYDRLNWFGFDYFGYSRYVEGVMDNVRPMIKGEVHAVMMVEEEAMVVPGDGGKQSEGAEEEIAVKPKEPSGPQLRRDFNETAFFFPDLKTDENGNIIIRFKMPESLTRWKMLGLAHTIDLKYGQVTRELVTRKELMVVPNAPRFYREGDTMVFTAKVINLSDNELSGTTTLAFFDAVSMTPVSILMSAPDQPFLVKKGQSAVVRWNIFIPYEGIQALTYQIFAKAGNYSDGEEKPLPVLTNRMLVTETLPLPVNGKQTKTFSFDKLVSSASSPTLKNHKLTLEFTSNPAWYAVQALPYLMEYPYECSEQVFSCLYANSLASHIVNSNPKIKRVFDSWKTYSPEALLSNLEKNRELKALILEETPWVMDAKNENERKQRISLLFDLNKMAGEQSASLMKLRNMQLPNGGWPWFKGMEDSRYITQHIVCGFGKMNHLQIKDVVGNDDVWQMVRRAVRYIDDRMREDYERIKELYPKEMDKNHLSSVEIHYLYTRSFYNAFNFNIDIDKQNREAFDYFKGQAQKYWTEQNIYIQGMIAIGLQRFGDQSTPADIIRSLKEHALHSEEMGMYWRENTGGYYWYQASIETQALLIETFEEVANDAVSVEEMKIWLLKHKQTQDWETTKATVEAVYALLHRGTDILVSEDLVQVTLGNNVIDPKIMDDVKAEAGTGYFKTSWSGKEITPDMGHVTVTKSDEGVAWGALYWQYFEQLDKITPHETPLKLEKKLFVERNTPSGPVIEPVIPNTSLHVGDRLKVRIELRVDRDMEYVHMKDMRASAFEPVNVLSTYKYEGGLGYYESTRDASTNFFFSYLLKGTYVFEYPMIVSQQGDFSNGITSIQCMYAPEFAAHSEGIRVHIGE
ncbi:MAG: MG2 domain-containing protein [Bacteroidetes bacterium]|nr:MG2 domain-containing protein [Bacteroidota bacterium]